MKLDLCSCFKIFLIYQKTNKSIKCSDFKFNKIRLKPNETHASNRIVKAKVRSHSQLNFKASSSTEN